MHRPNQIKEMSASNFLDTADETPEIVEFPSKVLDGII
jgi:hypothetical protein